MVTSSGADQPRDQRISELESQVRADHQLIENLQAALGTARRIGAAMGILMERRKITDDAAFALLAKASRDTQHKLREVAEEVILTGALPERASNQGR